MELCASLNHRKKTKGDGSRLIPRKHTETLVLLSVFYGIFWFWVVKTDSYNELSISAHCC